MSAEEEQAFVIRDRRGRGDEKPQSPQPEPAPGSTAESQETAASQDQGSASDMVPPLTFASFVFSLGTSALMLMGEQLDPQQGRPPVNLPQAKEIIDILSMLEAKTQGNLNAEEKSVLTDLLYALRMKYVDMASGKQATKTP
jgi:hypothetical protein